MFISIPWLVLFFFALIFVVGVLIYELNAKFKWKNRFNELSEETANLKVKLSKTSSLEENFDLIINKITKELSVQQRKIFLHTVKGLPSKDISDKMNISSSTVNSHIKEIMRHFKVNKRAQLPYIVIDKITNSSNGFDGDIDKEN